MKSGIDVRCVGIGRQGQRGYTNVQLEVNGIPGRIEFDHAIEDFGAYRKWASHTGFRSTLRGFRGTLSQYTEDQIIERAKEIAREHYAVAETLPFLVGDEHREFGWKKLQVNTAGEVEIRLPCWHEGVLSGRLEEYGVTEKCPLNKYWIFEPGCDIQDAKAILQPILAAGSRLVDKRQLVKMIDDCATNRGFIAGELLSQGSIQPSLF